MNPARDDETGRGEADNPSTPTTTTTDQFAAAPGLALLAALAAAQQRASGAGDSPGEFTELDAALVLVEMSAAGQSGQQATNAAAAPASVPGNHDHLRGRNYKYLDHWGEIPAGISAKNFNKAFNSANSSWIKQNPDGDVKAARANGTIARLARQRLGKE
ncbi:hypothetical protein GQ53DRAFT_828755 [Thozetella sp. PMI_491]|nr:hypothetical protein GQ53DRAFT_828755 [Thozetella sp. PMI_491]